MEIESKTCEMFYNKPLFMCEYSADLKAVLVINVSRSVTF